ncbi:MAG: LacI family transcriptional regulator [Brevundimonas sp.]|nr:LacI family transcriptional regulator [Brevundimonas sp.]
MQEAGDARGTELQLSRIEDEEAAAADNGLTPGRAPTINDIARIAGVSKKTVSRVINQSPFVKADTREKVEAVIADLGFSPDPQARGLAFRRSFLIGMIYDNPSPNYVVNMQQGILDAVRGSGMELVVHPCDRTTDDFMTNVRGFAVRQKLFGAVLPPSVSEDERVASMLNEVGCPYVRIASVSLDAPEHMVVTNDHVGAAEAARHLVELGHRRIGMITGPDLFRSTHERGDGFRRALSEAGVTLGEDMVVRGAYTFDSGVAAARELLSRKVRPTAIFAGNDEMAIGVYQAARDMGIDVPFDLSIVGFDDAPMSSRIWPTLTTVKLPIRDMGRMAAEKLLARSRGLDPAKLEQPEVIPTLIARDSSAPPRR